MEESTRTAEIQSDSDYTRCKGEDISEIDVKESVYGVSPSRQEIDNETKLLRKKWVKIAVLLMITLGGLALAAGLCLRMMPSESDQIKEVMSAVGPN